MGCLKLSQIKDSSPVLKILYSKYPLKKNTTFFLEEAQEKRSSGEKTGINLNPFGMTMQGRNFVISGGNSRFGYQGSERDPEYMGGNAYTTEFRMLDPRVGRWFSPDLITKPWESPYVSMGNNPIAFTDPMGLDETGGGTGTQTSSGDGFMTGDLAEVEICGNCGDADPTGDVGGGGGMQTAEIQTQSFSMGGYSPLDIAGAGKPADFPASNPAFIQNSVSRSNGAVASGQANANRPSFVKNANTDGMYHPIPITTLADIWWTMQPGWSVRLRPPLPDKPGVNISSVLPNTYFEGQSQGDNCKTTCDIIVKKANVDNPSGGSRYEVVGDGNQGEEDVLMEAGDVQKIIDKYLENNKPIIAGVNYKPDGPNTKYNTSSDHYIIIVGKGKDATGVYYTFFDVGTKRNAAGTSNENRLYLKEGKFQGATKYQAKHKYTLSQLRTYGK